MDVPAKLTLARALDALGVDIIEAGFPIASPADSEATRQIAREVRRPVIAALARCRPQDIDEAARALEPADAAAHPHVPRHLRSAPRAQAAHHARGLPRAGRRRRPRSPASFTDDVEFSAEDATRSDRDFLCRVVEAAIAHGATTINLPDTVGYATPEDLREFFEEIRRRVPNADKARLQRALPRRPRAGRRQQPGRGSGRRAADRVHDQRHRRARRQRVARRDRDGAPRPAAIGCRTDTGIKSRRACSRRASCSRSSPTSRSRRTRPSSAATRSRTRPASTRTAC